MKWKKRSAAFGEYVGMYLQQNDSITAFLHSTEGIFLKVLVFGFSFINLSQFSLFSLLV